jgi:hypothetical protein
VHADKHDLVFAHGQMYLGTDGGAYRTNTFGEWEDIENIPSTQFYRTTWNPHLPDLYAGGAQDNGTSWGSEAIMNEWPRLLGGDGFQPLFDPAEPSWMYALTQNGFVWFDDGFGFRQVMNGLEGPRYWDMPFVMSPFDSKILYAGSNQVYTINMRDTEPVWVPMSPDLTRGELVAGGRYPAITAIAQSPVDSLRLYAGTQDGKVWTTPDGGQTWVDVTEGTAGAFVTSIACSTLSPEGVYVTYSGYRDGDNTPYIFYSDNAGAAWTPAEGNLPELGVNNLMVLPGSFDQVLIIGTDGGVYVSFDAGVRWERVGSDMPYMPVYDVDYNPVTGRIIAATFSRGIMTFPVEELETTTAVADMADVRGGAFHLYPTIVTDLLWIEGQVPGLGVSCPVTIHDMNGRLVSQARIDPDSPTSLRLPAALPGGMYVVRIDSASGPFVTRIFKA